MEYELEAAPHKMLKSDLAKETNENQTGQQGRRFKSVKPQVIDTENNTVINTNFGDDEDDSFYGKKKNKNLKNLET